MKTEDGRVVLDDQHLTQTRCDGGIHMHVFPYPPVDV